MVPDPTRLHEQVARPLDYLEQAIADDQALARQISREARRPIPTYVSRPADMGPTEAWGLYLADIDPEWAAVA